MKNDTGIRPPKGFIEVHFYPGLIYSGDRFKISNWTARTRLVACSSLQHVCTQDQDSPFTLTWEVVLTSAKNAVHDAESAEHFLLNDGSYWTLSADGYKGKDKPVTEAEFLAAREQHVREKLSVLGHMIKLPPLPTDYARLVFAGGSDLHCIETYDEVLEKLRYAMS